MQQYINFRYKILITWYGPGPDVDVGVGVVVGPSYGQSFVICFSVGKSEKVVLSDPGGPQQKTNFFFLSQTFFPNNDLATPQVWRYSILL